MKNYGILNWTYWSSYNMTSKKVLAINNMYFIAMKPVMTPTFLILVLKLQP